MCGAFQEVAFVLPSLLGLLLDCATRPDQKLASISVEALARLMDGGAKHFSKKDWAMVLDSVRYLKRTGLSSCTQSAIV